MPDNTAFWTWPSVRDVAREYRVSETYVRTLIQQGRLRAVRTRLGLLIDPSSVAVYASGRPSRPAEKGDA